ncbi:MAG: TIGR04222 domain-containing membrane protein [Lentisphaeraceae bacterium]|nr:TIGR04222 domain-containing membrane protein [Lentisphaeraceae bacterium]
MKGPQFLLFYAAAIVGGLVLFRVFRFSFDSSRRLPRMKLPVDLDPYLISYMKGGVKNIIPTAFASLLQKQAVSLSGNQILKSKNIPEINSDLEKCLLSKVKTSGSSRTELMDSSVEKNLSVYCDKYSIMCKNEELLINSFKAAFLTLLKGIIMFSLLALGAIKCIHALNNGRHNILFLVIEIVIMLIVLGKFCNTNKISYRGRKFLEDLMKTNETLKDKAKSKDLTPEMCALGTVLFGTAFISASNLSGLGQVFNFQSTKNSILNSSGFHSCSGCTSCASCSSCDSGCGGCGGD